MLRCCSVTFFFNFIFSLSLSLDQRRIRFSFVPRHLSYAMGKGGGKHDPGGTKAVANKMKARRQLQRLRRLCEQPVRDLR